VSRRLIVIVGVAFAALACGSNPMGPSPEATPGTNGPQEPQGLFTLNDQAWVAVTGNGWRYLRRTGAKDADIARDATAPVSPPDVLRIIFTSGMSRDSEPSVNWMSLPGPREVYTRWWMKLSPNWTGSPAGGGKITFLHVRPDGQGQVYTALLGSSAPHAIVVNTEWRPYGQKFWTPNVTTTPIFYDRWYGVGWYVRWESAPGVGDGVLRWWVDDVLNGDYTQVSFPAGGSGFQQFEFAPTRQNPPAAEQYLYIDHTDVSAR
jgi:hypothetical protein